MNSIKKSSRQKAVAKKIIRRRMLFAAGLGLIPIPIVDAASILSTQVLMLRDIARVYKVPFKGQRAKSLIGALVGSLATTGLLKVVPGLGSTIGGAAMSLTGVAATYAIGKVFTLHFEQGGTLLDFDPVKSRKYFEQAFKEGEIKAAALKTNNKKKLTQLLTAQSAEKTLGTKGQTKQTNIEPQVLSRQAKIDLLKARRQKVAKKKRRRKARFRKIIAWSFVLGLIALLGTWFYTKYAQAYFDKDAAETTEVDLFMKENQAQKIALQPAGTLDSLTQAIIAGFSPVSTEGVIAKHLQNPNATYPKRYSLNAVRFIGSSEELSSGASKQLANIAFLMKKYPDLLINLYGHTGNTGPKFNRQRIGRDRARVLKEVFINQGIPSYRITGNYIEKAAGTHDEHWGAEIVLHVSTIESVVEITPPSLPRQPRSPIKKIFKRVEKELKEDTQALTETILPPSKPMSDTSQAAVVTDSINTNLVNTDSFSVDSTDLQIVNDSSSNNQIDTVTASSPTSGVAPPEKKPTTTEGVMRQYLESTNPSFPKIFSLSGVLFEGESTEVDAKGIAQLIKIATLMEQYPKMKISIAGFAAAKATVTSETEKQQFLAKWQDIGQKRAQAIKKILHEKGIANRRMNTSHRFQNRGIDSQYWGADITIESN